MSKQITFTKYDALGNVIVRHVYTAPAAIAVINAKYVEAK